VTQIRFLPILQAVLITVSVTSAVLAETGQNAVSDDVIAAQNASLAAATAGAGFGPQSPRDLTQAAGANPVDFGEAPDVSRMNLCNIHFHHGAEHRGGEFTKYAGNGDGHGYGSGYLYTGTLTDAELAPVDYKVGNEKHSTLRPGDTIEIHYVHTTARIDPGPTLNSCMDEAIGNPQLSVVGFVYVLVNDDSAANLQKLNEVVVVDGLHQAVNMPLNLGDPTRYHGSSTGPSFNEAGSPFQVSWTVYPKVVKVSISSVAAWLSENEFDEDHGHGVRNLITNPDLLAPIN